METENGKGAGESFTEDQKSTDTALNNRMKAEKGETKLDPKDANNPKNRNRKSDIASKKSGGGKQTNPGM
jgi:hypothetical protein